MHNISQKEDGVKSRVKDTSTLVNPVVLGRGRFVLIRFAGLAQVHLLWGSTDFKNQLLCAILKRFLNLNIMSLSKQ